MAEKNMKDDTAAGESALHGTVPDGKESPGKEAPCPKAGGGKAAAHRKEAVQEQYYTAAELAACAGSLFGTRRECAEAALRAAGKQEYTMKEAAGIVKQFLKKEVR